MFMNTHFVFQEFEISFCDWRPCCM